MRHTLLSWLLLAAGCDSKPAPPSRAQPLDDCLDHPHALTAGAETPTSPPQFYCIWFCQNGWIDCNGDLQNDRGDGCETDATSTDHCGSCINHCAPGVPCSPNVDYCDRPGTTCSSDSTYFCGAPLNCQDNTCCPRQGDTSYHCPDVACCDGDVCINGVCSACRTTGATCQGDDQCCDGHACQQGVCQACFHDGAACTTNGQCCGGTCSNGQCTCRQGSACNTGQLGLCKVGEWQCNTLTCTQTVFPQPDTDCDGKDDDCDGHADEDYQPQPCTYTGDGTTICQTGFAMASTSQCKDGHETACVQPTGFCNQCDGYECGECSGFNCTPGSTKCLPGYACYPGPPNTPTQCMPNQSCSPLTCWTWGQVTLTGCM
jgi:hypothetical protein